MTAPDALKLTLARLTPPPLLIMAADAITPLLTRLTSALLTLLTAAGALVRATSPLLTLPSADDASMLIRLTSSLMSPSPSTG
eukprot:838345-Prorocentrum_minimum.AAC.2